MGTQPQHPSRTAGAALREINQCGRLRPDPEYLAGQKALREKEAQEARRLPKRFPKKALQEVMGEILQEWNVPHRKEK